MKMKAQTKRTIGNLFGSIISNQRAIDGAKESPWWIALIFLVISAFLPVIPSMVTASNLDGGSFITSSTYNYDQDNGVMDTSLQFLKEGYEMKMGEGGLRMYQNDSVAALTDHVDSSYYIQKVHTKKFSNDPVTGDAYSTNPSVVSYFNIAETRMVYVDGSSGDANVIINYLTSLYYRTDIDFENQEPTSKDNLDSTLHYYIPSMLIFYRTGLVYQIYKIGTTTTATTSYTANNWNHTTIPNGMLHRLLTQEGKETYLSKEYLDSYVDYATSFPASEKDYVTASYKRLAGVFSEAYTDTKNNTFVVSVFMYLGIYLALILIMGLMIFLLTRGKSNVFNYLKLWPCLKIAMWASFSPAVLGLIFGLMSSSFAVMGFIIFEGVRIMWLCMKQLRPQ